MLFSRVVGWRCLRVLLRLGGRRLGLRRGLILPLTLNPSNREKTLATCLRSSSSSRGRRRRCRSGRRPLRAQNVKERNDGTSGSRRNRSSLSRTSASASDRAHHISQSPLPPQPLPKSKGSQSRSRSNTSSQSPSLPSKGRGSSSWRMGCQFERVDGLEVANSRLDRSVVAAFQ